AAKPRQSSTGRRGDEEEGRLARAGKGLAPGVGERAVAGIELVRVARRPIEEGARLVPGRRIRRYAVVVGRRLVVLEPFGLGRRGAAHHLAAIVAVDALLAGQSRGFVEKRPAQRDEAPHRLRKRLARGFLLEGQGTRRAGEQG